MSGKPIGVIESTSIAPSSIRYRAPTLTWGRVHIRTLQVISPRRIPSRKRLVKTTRTVYTVEYLRELAKSIQIRVWRTGFKREDSPDTLEVSFIPGNQNSS